MPYLNLDPATATAVVPSLGAPLVGLEETLATLRDELLLMLGARDDVTPDRLDRWINQAYRDLPSSLDIPEFHVGISFSTVVAQPLYLLPTTVVRTKRASLVDTVNYSDGGVPLRKIDEDFYRGLPNLQDLVTSYFFMNRLLVLYPTPSSIKVVSIDAYIRPQKLVSNTDSPIISVDWHEALMLSARSKAFRSLLEWEAGEKAEGDFISHVRRKTDSKSDEKTGIVAAFRPARSYRALHRQNRQSNGDF